MGRQSTDSGNPVEQESGKVRNGVIGFEGETGCVNRKPERISCRKGRTFEMLRDNTGLERIPCIFMVK